MSRFWKYFWVTLYCVVLAASPVFANLIGDLNRLGLDMTGDPVKLQGTLDFYINSGYVDMAEISKPANPATNRGKLYVKDVDATTSLMFLDSAGTETNLLTAGSGGTTNLKVGSDIASPAGGELTLGDGTYFNITGTNNITSIAAASATAGRLVILHFADALTFTDGNNLKLAGNLVTTADDLITLLCDGTNCYEMARSAN